MGIHLPTTERAAHAGMRLTVLGATGSMAVSRKGREFYGGATSCYMVQAGEDCVFLDAGSGLLAAPSEFPNPPLILLSHLHLDHMLGLGMYRRLLMKGEKTRLCMPTPDVESGREMLDRLYSPPFWPLSLLDCAGELELVPPRFPMQYGAFHIESMPGNHPGGCLVFKLSGGGKSMVYLTDYEYTPDGFSEIVDFARGTDLLLCDGQYSEEEYQVRRGFGHSSPEKGIHLKERCGAKQLLLIHHNPFYSDTELHVREALIHKPGVHFAHEGEVIDL